jgi:hypothetical protein
MNPFAPVTLPRYQRLLIRASLHFGWFCVVYATCVLLNYLFPLVAL